MLAIENLRKSYGGGFALRVGRLGIGPGVTALLGPNGSGKSTLLGILAGIIPADGGSVRLDGMELRAGEPPPPRWRRRVTLVAQKPYLFGGTVRDNVAWGLKVRGVPRRVREGKIAEALARLGISGLAGRRARELSGGEYQMAALARALVLDPGLLLLDEPTAHIDRENAGRIECLVRSLGAGGGPAVFFATHNLAQASRLASAVVSLEEGSVGGPP